MPSSYRTIRFLTTLVIVAALWATIPRITLAQGGPENLLLVVNAESDSSKLLANYYAYLRKIPPSHVVHLDGVPDRETTTEDEFRSRILAPVLMEIKNRGLAKSIDYIVYSSDFPTSISIPDSQARLFEAAGPQGQALKDQSAHPYLPAASLTSLTYFAGQVMRDDPSFMMMNANRYMRVKRGAGYLPTRSLHSSAHWTADGLPTGNPDRDPAYTMSAILSVTRNMGMSEQDALKWMVRTVAADGNPPAGPVYFGANRGVRAQARKPFFPDAISELGKLGIRTEVTTKIIPQNRRMAGFVAGSVHFKFAEARSEFSAGSICENLTSWGAVFTSESQTKCTEFLRYGAAGSSGCVTEPLAIPAKFPHPMIQVHYARGCTLGEAFYQSVAAPFQTLLVGDPLCRPYGKLPTVEVTGIADDEPASGIVPVQIRCGDQVPVAQIQVWADGKLLLEQPAAGPVELDTRDLGDGYHEIRFVAVSQGLIETGARQIVPLVVDNHGHQVTISTDRKKYDLDDTIVVQVDANWGDSVLVFHQDVLVGQLEKQQGQIEFAARLAGRGPIRLQAIAVSSADQSQVFSQPALVTVNGEVRTTVPKPDVKPRPAAKK